MEQKTQWDKGTLKAPEGKQPHAVMRKPEELRHMPAQELSEKRTANTKFFSLGENLYQSVIYPAPVHYQDAVTGAWEEIDNGLVEETLDGGRTCLTNRANGGLKVRLSSAESGRAVELTGGNGAKLSWMLEGSAPRQPKHMAKRAAKSMAAQDFRQVALDKGEDEAVYEEVLPDTDLRCRVESTMFKDDVVFKTRRAARAVSFLISAPGLVLERKADASIEAVDQQGEVRFLLPAPFMLDANEKDGPVSISLTDLGAGRWRLTYMPDSAWLDAAAYPVVIDPVVLTEVSIASGNNVYVTSKKPTQAATVTSNQILVAKDHTTNGTCISYLRVNSTALPKIDSSYYVTKAELALCAVSSTSQKTPVYAREVLENWTATTLTYNNQPQLGEMVLDVQTPKASTSGTVTTAYINFDISNLVRKWYGGENHGIALEVRESAKKVQFYASSNTTNKPVLAINYISLAGLEDYLSFESHSVGRAGTAHVNLFNGNLVFTHADTVSTGSRMPVSVSHTYNSCYHDVDLFSAGKGWKHSLFLTLHREKVKDQTNTLRTYYVFTDGDGTRHYFSPVGTSTTSYEDMSGLSLKLTISGSEVTIRDKGDNVMRFALPTVDSTGKDGKYTIVKDITDAHGNKAYVTMEGGAVTQVMDGAGRITYFSFTGTNGATLYPPSLEPEEDMPGVHFAYDDTDHLLEIQHEDGEVTRYAYDARGLLVSVENFDGRTLAIEYTETAPYRVSCIQETNGDMAGNCRLYTYGDCMTTVTDGTVENGKKLYYHFNDYGNVVSANDMLGHAAVSTFTEQTPVNHPAAVSKLQRVVVNLLKNHSFETGEAWALEGEVGYDEGSQYQGSRCLSFANRYTGVRCSASQALALEAGKTYTMSFFVKRCGPMALSVAYAYTDAEGALQTVEGPPLVELMTFDYERLSWTFTLPEDMESSLVTLTIRGDGGTDQLGKAWIDCAQLEEGTVPNRYALLENAGFSRVEGTLAEGWTLSTAAEEEDGICGGDDVEKPEGFGANVLRLHSRPGKAIYAYQDVPLAGVKDDVFIAGGWAKGYTKPIQDAAGKHFNLRVAFKNGTAYTDAQRISFGEEWTNWQFTCGAVIAPVDYSAVRLYIDYQDNVNYADFDGLFLYKERFGQSFSYDDDGNVLSVENLTGTKSNAEYDAYDNLTSYRQPGHPASEKTTLFYGDTVAQKKRHLVRKETSPAGVEQHYTYDARGNCTQTKVTGVGTEQFMQSMTAYTEDDNYVASQTDARGQTRTVDVDARDGTLRSVTVANGQTTTYAYDVLRRMTEMEAIVEDRHFRSEYTYVEDKIAEVRHNTSDDEACDVVYSFAYNDLGNKTAVKVGEQVLSTNHYAETGDQMLESVEYGNGDTVHYERDAFKRVTGVRYNDEATPRYTYAMDANGEGAQVHDHVLGRVKMSEYDLSNRPSFCREFEGSAHIYSTKVGYDECNRISRLNEQVGPLFKFYNTGYRYDLADRLTELSYGARDRDITYTYNPLGQVTSRKLVGDTGNYESQYTYVAGAHGEHSTTPLIQSIDQPGLQLSYAYDSMGYIASESRNDVAITYAYDGLGQLVRVNDPRQDRTITYTYDRGGNLLGRQEHAYSLQETLDAPLHTVSYVYEDANWRDKLTHYNGTPITYDAIGNPLSDGTWAYTWQAGRQLAHLQGATDALDFAYNADGLRVRKTSQTRGTTEYTLRGANIVHQKRGDHELHFYYGATGQAMMATYNGHDYYYVHNAQGDVIAMLDAVDFAKVVEYQYDAWGRQIGCTGAMAGTLGVENPFRYRGYVYDEETGWYALPARFYNPQYGRFVNADILLGNVGALLSHNAFAYCHNSPVAFRDPSGHSRVVALVAAAVATALAIAKAVAIASQMTAAVKTAGAGAVAGAVAGRNRNCSDVVVTNAPSTEVGLPKVNVFMFPMIMTPPPNSAFVDATYAKRIVDKITEHPKDMFHNFPLLIDELTVSDDFETRHNGDGSTQYWISLDGYMVLTNPNGGTESYAGTYEWIVDTDGMIHHRFFRPSTFGGPGGGGKTRGGGAGRTY